MINNKKEIKKTKAQSEGINFKKSLGQNFIFDKNLLTAIAFDSNVTGEDTVLEIGAGAGTLTDVLAGLAKNVVSFEIDRSLEDKLNEVKSKHNNLEIIYQDFMNADLNSLNLKSAKVIANIPYYITTPIVFKLIDNLYMFDSISILIQKEVAERFSAKHNSKEYGITSVILQSIFDVKITRIVKKECFTPSPKVDSAVCVMVPHGKYFIEDFDAFKDFVKKCFAMRRKTLYNNLKVYYEKEKILNSIQTLNFKENVRPEEIDVDSFVKLNELINE